MSWERRRKKGEREEGRERRDRREAGGKGKAKWMERQKRTTAEKRKGPARKVEPCSGHVNGGKICECRLLFCAFCECRLSVPFVRALCTEVFSEDRLSLYAGLV